MNFWTFLDRNGFGLFWLALMLIGTCGGIAGALAAKENPPCQCAQTREAKP